MNYERLLAQRGPSDVHAHLNRNPLGRKNHLAARTS